MLEPEYKLLKEPVRAEHPRHEVLAQPDVIEDPLDKIFRDIPGHCVDPVTVGLFRFFFCGLLLLLFL